jgi:FdhD protein
MDAIRRVTVQREGAAGGPEDEVAVEEPLEIRLAGQPLAVLMRTPGHDIELAAGFLLTEGILPMAAALGSIAQCRDPEEKPLANVVNVIPAGGATIAPVRERRFDATAACGICGKDRIEDIRVRAAPIRDPLRVARGVVRSLAGALAGAQVAFQRTGGVHAAALFDPAGRLLRLREDVGRHNAVDKVVGRSVIDDEVPLAGRVLVVSGRVGFEIAQKAVVAGIPVLAGVSAPSSLAIDLAREMGLTLIGFLREGRFTVYAGAERIID